MCHYLKTDPFFRKDNHKDITFSLMYAFSENFILPMSHDEVVHMKGSLVNKMPGGYEQQLICLKGFYAYMLAHPGKKLLFMGPELGQWHEWNHSGQIDWYLLDNELNEKLHDFFRDINHFYMESPELWEIDYDWSGFEWLVTDDTRNNTVVFMRRDKKGHELLCAVNFSPNVIDNYRIGVTERKEFVPVFSTEDEKYFGLGSTDKKPVRVERKAHNGRSASISIKLPAYGGVFYRGRGELPPADGKGSDKKSDAVQHDGKILSYKTQEKTTKKKTTKRQSISDADTVKQIARKGTKGDRK